jgi:N-acyl-D-amino-acid deacylase
LFADRQSSRGLPGPHTNVFGESSNARYTNPMIRVLLLTSLTALSLGSATAFDLIIRNGRIADGTGNPAYFADVGVKNGRVAQIGKIAGPAPREVDATGMIVAPGFIDVHTHADEVAEHPKAENFLRMGVTTLIVGNCGGSELNVGKLFADIEREKVSPNVATLIGHNTVRRQAMGGSFDRPPTAAELEQMQALVDTAMKDGAVGLSTGLIYLPGVFSQTDEIIALAKTAARYDGIYASHMRHENHEIFAALDEVFRIAREAKIRAEVSHIKLSGEKAWGKAEDVLAYIEKQRAAGLDITHDQYAYTASSTTMRQLIPDEAFDGGSETFLKLIGSPESKARLVAQMKEKIRARGREDYAYAVIASYSHDPSLNGLNIVEAAKKVRGGDSLDNQIEMILALEINGSASGVFHGMSEPDLQKFMQHPNTMIACDSGLRVFGQGVPHPRGYGNNARVLGRYVRELKVLRLEDAIRKMTNLPANTFRIKERGLIKEGFWADIVVFDPEKVTDPAAFNDPHHYAIGIPHVFVNGEAVIANSEHTGARPGQGLRHQAMAKQ